MKRSEWMNVSAGAGAGFLIFLTLLGLQFLLFKILALLGVTTGFTVTAISAFNRILASIILTVGVASIAFGTVEARRKSTEFQAKVATLEKIATEEPEKAKPASDVANEKLQQYFDRNLSQVRLIFYAALGAMVVGFSFVMIGIELAVSHPETFRMSLVASGSGIITEFIGLSFMALYKNTVSQAAQYVDVLERINVVNMSMQILDTLPESEGQLRNTTRAEIAKLLLSTRTTATRPRTTARR
jgi:hypothetical protein